MNLPRHRFQITSYDHREDPPRRRFQTYTDPESYRRALEKLQSAAHGYSRSTRTKIHLYPEEKGGWLKDDEVRRAAT